MKDEMRKSMRKTFRLYREAAERRKRVKLPQTEEEMTEQARRFAEKNRDILDELAKI
jgi:hypothetical protein